jgi:hypothetical protein
MGKCTSWLGHKFEGRYSQAPSSFRIEDSSGISAEELAVLANEYRTKTYERDICVRCGHVVEKKP